MTAAEPFLRAAIAAIDEAGDPTSVRATIEEALVEAAPLARIARPTNAKKRVAWAVRQLAMAADNPARAYSRLRELLAALFEPFADASSRAGELSGAAHGATFAEVASGASSSHRAAAPAPEVAAAMTSAALVDALAPPPRVLSRDIASTAKLDARALLAEPALARRVLGVRSIPQASIGGYASELAVLLAGEPRPPGDDAVASAMGSVETAILRAETSAMASVESAILREETIAICVPAAEKTRAKVAAALLPYLASPDGGVRASTIDGLHALKQRLDSASLLAGMRDPVAAVRASTTRTIAVGPLSPRPTYPPEIDMALISALSDIDGAVRTAALGAIARYPKLKGPALVEPLRAVVRRADGDDMRTAIYLLGELGAQAAAAAEDLAAALPISTNPYQTGQALLAVTSGAANERIVETLRACVAGPRSSAAHTAAFVLDKLGLPIPEVAEDLRLARATDELASADPDVQRSGMSEAERLADASSLIPAIQAIGERVAAAEDLESKALLRKVRDTLSALGVAAHDLPRPPSRLEAYMGIAPREQRVHGAYAIASIEGGVEHGAVSVPTSSLGLWDNGTGKRLFVVERAELLELVPGRAEAAIVRTPVRADAKYGGTRRSDLEWWFERYSVPAGERVASLRLPAALTYGWPTQLSIAADLATVWCGDEDSPYRFHIKLGDPDVLLDEEPNLGRRAPRPGVRRGPS